MKTAEQFLIESPLDLDKEVPQSSIIAIMQDYAAYMCEQQREICAKQMLDDAMHDFGTTIADCWNDKSILNAPLATDVNKAL